MKVVIQRCKSGAVSVQNKTINTISQGFVILVGIATDDTEKDLDYLVNKILKLRVFDDENGVMNRSIIDINGQILSVSQFTLQASTKDGNRPSYIKAMNGHPALRLYELFNIKLNEQIPTFAGVFGAEMLLNIQNDGPVTIIIDSKIK